MGSMCRLCAWKQHHLGSWPLGHASSRRTNGLPLCHALHNKSGSVWSEPGQCLGSPVFRSCPYVYQPLLWPLTALLLLLLPSLPPSNPSPPDQVGNIISQSPDLSFPINQQGGGTWLLTTYLDEDTRITRGDGGSVFILVKEVSIAPMPTAVLDTPAAGAIAETMV